VGHGERMVLAEAPMIDPGFIILLLTLLALGVAATAAFIAGTIVAGRRYGLDPTRRVALVCWFAGMAVEMSVLISGLLTRDGPGWSGVAAIGLVGAVLGWLDGRRSAAEPAEAPTRR